MRFNENLKNFVYFFKKIKNKNLTLNLIYRFLKQILSILDCNLKQFSINVILIEICSVNCK